MMFFIYLALHAMKNQSAEIDGVIKSSGADIKLTFGFPVIGEMAIVIGLVLGGLIAANAIGLAGAKAGMGMAKSFGGWVGKKAGQKGLNAAGKVVGSDRVKGWTEKLAEGGMIRRLASQGLNFVGMKTEKATQKSYDDEIKDYKGPRLENEIRSSRGPRLAALINKAVKDKDISEKVRKEVLSDPDNIEKIENDLKRAGYKPDGFAKLIGYNSKVLRAVIKGNADEIKKVTDEFYSKFDKKDWANITPGSLTDDRVQRVIMDNLLINSAGSLSAVLSSTKKGNDVDKIIAYARRRNLEIKNPELRKKIEDSIEKSLAKRFYEFEEEKEEKKEEKNEEKKK
jgi:hypothetical protein